MLPIKKTNKSNLPLKNESGIVWKENFWKRKTTIFYSGKEIGYFQTTGFFKLGGKGVLLDREFEIKGLDYGYKNFEMIEIGSNKVIATLKNNISKGKVSLYVDNEIFHFKKNSWNYTTWWWQRNNGEKNEQLIKTTLTNFMTGIGEFRFGNTGESNLNALILAGLFINKMTNEGTAIVY